MISNDFIDPHGFTQFWAWNFVAVAVKNSVQLLLIL